MKEKSGWEHWKSENGFVPESTQPEADNGGNKASEKTGWQRWKEANGFAVQQDEKADTPWQRWKFQNIYGGHISPNADPAQVQAQRSFVDNGIAFLQRHGLMGDEMQERRQQQTTDLLLQRPDTAIAVFKEGKAATKRALDAQKNSTQLARDSAIALYSAERFMFDSQEELNRIVEKYGGTVNDDGSVSFPTEAGTYAYRNKLQESDAAYERYCQAWDNYNFYAQEQQNAGGRYRDALKFYDAAGQKLAVDIDGDARTDLYFPGGQAAYDEELRKHNEKYDYVNQDAGTHITYLGEALGRLRAENLSSQEAESLWNEITLRINYMLYGDVWIEPDGSDGSMSDDAVRSYTYWLGVVNEAAKEWRKEHDDELTVGIPSNENAAQEFRYIHGHFLGPGVGGKLAPESIPFKSTDRLLDKAAEDSVKKKFEEGGIEEIRMTALFGYLANTAMSQEQYDRFLGICDAVGKKDFAKTRAANGLNANVDAAHKAVYETPYSMEVEDYFESVGFGAETGRDFLFLGVPGGVEDAATTVVGSAAALAGNLMNGFGLWHWDVADDVKNWGAKTASKVSDSTKEYEQAQYSRSRDFAAVTSKNSKVGRWAMEGLNAIGNIMTVSGAAQFATGTAMMSAPAVPTPLTPKIVQWATKNAGNVAISSQVVVDSAIEGRKKGMQGTELFLYAAGNGAIEYFSNKISGGNPLEDGADGLLNKWISKWVKNKSFAKALNFVVGDLAGEGAEELVALLGSSGMDFVFTGETELTGEQMLDEFVIGMFCSALLSGGQKGIEQMYRGIDYVKVEAFSKFDHKARTNAVALNEQMTKYAVEYLGGDAELMRAAGWSEDQITKAQKEWKRILGEYNTAFVDMAKHGKYKLTESGTPSAEALIESAEGVFGDVAAVHFTPATIQEDLDDIIAARDKMESNATKHDAAASINAQVGKMAQVAMQQLDAALEQGYIGQLQYDNYKETLNGIYEDCRNLLSEFLDYAYAAETTSAEAAVQDAIQTETAAEQTDAGTNVDAVESIAENAVATTDAAETFETEQKNMTAEPSENLGGFENAKVLNDGSQRDAGLGTRRQGRTVEGSTGGSVAASQIRSEADVLADVRENSTAQSARSIGVENGSEDASVYVLSDEDIESVPQWQGIKHDAEADGAKVVFFAGDLRVYNRTRGKYSAVEGVHQTDGNGNTTYYIKVDAAKRDAQQIYLHEKFHDIVPNDSQLLRDLVNELNKHYSKKQIRLMAERYADAYDGIYGRFTEGMTDEEVDALVMQYMSELFADVYADIQRVRGNYEGAELVMESQSDALRAAAQNRRTMEKENAPPGQRFTVDKYYERQIEQWDGKDHGGAFRVGTVSKPLLLVGVPNKDIWFDQSKAEKQLEGKVEVDKRILKEIPSLLEHPIVIAESYDDTVLVFGKLYDDNGSPIVVAIRINSTNRRNRITQINKIRSVGTRTHNLDKLLKDDNILYLDPNKKETNNWFNALGRSTPFGGTKFGLIRSISFGVPEVKQEFSVEGDKARLEDRVQGDDYLNAMDLIDEITAVGAEVDENGYVTVYHRTNDAAATLIRKTGVMQAKEDGLFFSTNPDGSNNYGYGDSVITLKVPAEKLLLDDVFDDEASVKIPLENRRRMNVSEYIVSDQDSSTQQFSFEENENAPPGQHYSLNQSFISEVENWIESTDYDARVHSGGWFKTGTISSALESIGMRPTNIYWRKFKIGKILDEHPEMTAKEIGAVPKILEDPVVVAKSKTQEDSIIAFGDLVAQNGQKVMVAVNLTPIPTGGMEAEFSQITSAYGRSNNNVKNLLFDSEILYFGTDKKRTDSWLMSLGLQLPSGQPVYGPIGNIAYVGDKVNINGRKIEFLNVATQTFSVADDVAELDARYEQSVADDGEGLDAWYRRTDAEYAEVRKREAAQEYERRMDDERVESLIAQEDAKKEDRPVFEIGLFEDAKRDEMDEAAERVLGTMADERRLAKERKIEIPKDFSYSKDKPFNGALTTLSPTQTIRCLEAITQMRWVVKPNRKGLWTAVETSDPATPTMPAQKAWDMLKNSKPDRTKASATTVNVDGVKKIDFTSTPAIDKIGVKIDGSITNYASTQEMLEREEKARKTRALVRRTEKKLAATKEEKNIAMGIATGDLTYNALHSKLDYRTVTELVKVYTQLREVGADLIMQRKRAIRDGLTFKMIELFPSELEIAENPKAFRGLSLSKLNYMTPQRSMRKIFGDDKGEEICAYLFDPIARNEASKIRWVNEQTEKMRKHLSSDGKMRPLKKVERSYVHMMLDIEGCIHNIQEDWQSEDILKAAENVANGADAMDNAIEFGLNAEQAAWMRQYAEWLGQKKSMAGKIDEVKCKNAAKAYRQIFDDYYDALVDFLTAHGDSPIGKIDYYSPHFKMRDKVNLLNSILESIGGEANATTLPAEIAGRTEEFRPSKRWTPFFLSRKGSQTDYDIVHGFESYITYMSDVLFHHDDIQKLRAAEATLRSGLTGSVVDDLTEVIEMSRSGDIDEKIDWLFDNEFSNTREMSRNEVSEKFDKIILSLTAENKNQTRYSNLVQWLLNEANVLSGKQFGGDRGVEHRGGRGALTLGNKLIQAFAKANVAGNISSAFNQIQQIEAALSECSTTSVAQATAEFVSGRLRDFAMESDYLTGKRGIEYIDSSVGQKALELAFIPIQVMDKLTSTIGTRAAYLDAVKAGKDHETAMRMADKFARGAMADRTKGTKPLGFHSKSFLWRALNFFQLEPLNNWEHIVRDLPADFRRIAKESGKAKAARHLVATIIKMLLAAFFINRLTDDLYGGTPMQFDVIGLSSNFIASGKGLTTNDYLRHLINKISYSLFKTEAFDDLPEEKEEFDWDAAISDTAWNLGNEVPFVSNATGIFGVGDQSLPMPDIAGNVKDIYKAIDKSGLWSEDSVQALIKFFGEMFPGGRQITKTYSGIEAIAEGGMFYGSGDNERLQFVNEDSLWGDMRKILFGINASEEAQRYYAADEGGLSARQTKAWKALVEGGRDKQYVFDLIKSIRKAEDDENLTNTEIKKNQRKMITDSKLSDEEKAYLYSMTFGKEDENGIYATSRDEAFDALMECGMSWAEVMEVFEKYTEIYNDENLSQTQQDTEMAFWVDQNVYSKEQKDIINAEFRFWYNLPAESERYDNLTAAGMSPEEAKAIVDAYDNFEDIKIDDKINVILKKQMSEDDTYAALLTVLNESCANKLSEAIAVGIPCETYMKFWMEAKSTEADDDDDGKAIRGSRKKKILDLIDALNLTPAQKDLILEGYYKNSLDEAPWN